VRLGSTAYLDRGGIVFLSACPLPDRHGVAGREHKLYSMWYVEWYRPAQHVAKRACAGHVPRGVTGGDGQATPRVTLCMTSTLAMRERSLR
jgi:hypothetical protein